jgi:hypothetical protein
MAVRPVLLDKTAWTLVCLVCVAFAPMAGCGEKPAGEKQYTLPDVENLPETEDSGFRFGEVDNPDGSETDATPSDTSADATETGDVQTDADANPPAGITSCKAHCGILLTDVGNACSCHPSCKNDGTCCEDFVVTCSCPTGGDAACDDGDDCTTDTCKNSYCQQIPKPGKSCCHADADCSGGDKCNVAKCIEGSCTLKTTSCDDALTCTNDVCDPANGECIHKLLLGQCAIDGACKKAGDNDPASNGCAICDPGQSTSAWSPKAGTCAIGGECYKSGDFNPAGTCALCDPSKSTSAWTVKAGNCLIDGACFPAKTPNPGNPSCEVCDPTTSTSAWSGVAGKCAIGGVCYASGDADPAAPTCSACDPTKNKAGFSLKAGFCLLDGQCVKAGAGLDGTGGCKSCDPAKSTSAWTAKATGATCDDGSICSTSDKCDATGSCKGAFTAGCCVSDDDCKTMQAQAGDCEKAACNLASGKCAIVPVPNCCLDGKCCDIPNKTLRAKNTVCNDTISVGIQYQCNGQAVEQRKLFYGCTGDSPTKCSSDTPGYGNWTPTGKVCAVDETCVLVSASQTPTCKPQ